MRLVKGVESLAERSLREIATEGEEKADSDEEVVVMIVEEEEL